MSKENPTYMERGVRVFISLEEFEILCSKPGVLSIENYPDLYKEIALPGEVGRFMALRLFAIDNIDLSEYQNVFDRQFGP